MKSNSWLFGLESIFTELPGSKAELKTEDSVTQNKAHYNASLKHRFCAILIYERTAAAVQAVSGLRKKQIRPQLWKEVKSKSSATYSSASNDGECCRKVKACRGNE